MFTISMLHVLEAIREPYTIERGDTEILGWLSRSKPELYGIRASSILSINKRLIVPTYGTVKPIRAEMR